MSNNLEEILHGLKQGLPQQRWCFGGETSGRGSKGLSVLRSKNIKGRSVPLKEIGLYTSKNTGIKVKFMPLDQYLLVAPKE